MLIRCFLEMFKILTYPALRSAFEPDNKSNLIGERFPLILRSRDCDPYRRREFDVSSSIMFCPLPTTLGDRLLAPIAGEINDTSNDTVLFFLNIPRRFSALHGAFG